MPPTGTHSMVWQACGQDWSIPVSGNAWPNYVTSTNVRERVVGEKCPPKARRSLLRGRLVGLLGRLLLRLELCTQLLDEIIRLHLKRLAPPEHGHLNVLATRLDDLEQRTARELDAVDRRLLIVVLLEELLDSLLIPPRGNGLPGSVVARRLRLVQPRGPISVKTHEERRDAKGPNAAALRVTLLDAGDVLGNVLHRGRVLKCEPVALALDASFVDEDTSVSR
mmetsp:Transcript_83861/g.167397  ORF Transcript_83861/g.167397 Transcript_83861/m.167397 type:complete len:223 (+) Transcript_83861:97-765(+)